MCVEDVKLYRSAYHFCRPPDWVHLRQMKAALAFLTLVLTSLYELPPLLTMHPRYELLNILYWSPIQVYTFIVPIDDSHHLCLVSVEVLQSVCHRCQVIREDQVLQCGCQCPPDTKSLVFKSWFYYPVNGK